MFLFLCYCHWKRSDEEEGWRTKRASPDQQFLNLGSPFFHTGYIRSFHERYLVNWLLESVKMNNDNCKMSLSFCILNIKSFLSGKVNDYQFSLLIFGADKPLAQ